MKNMLIQNYNLVAPKIYYYGDKVYITDGNNKYELITIKAHHQLDIILNLLNICNKKNYNEIIARNRQVIVEFRNRQYILIKKKKHTKKIIDILKEKQINIEEKLIKYIEWDFLWKQKNNKIEYIHNSTKGTNKIIDESIDYFLGMAENAITYYKEISHNHKRVLTITHRRIDDIHNPLNIIIDEKERDIGEYIKYIFFQKINLSQEINKINEIIIEQNLSYEKIYARLLYPTYYFDKLELYEKDKSHETEFIEIIARIEEYEKYLKKIYITFTKKKLIKKIDWIN